MREAVKTVIRGAIRRTGKAEGLSHALFEIGIAGPGGQAYDHRTVNSWARGVAMPPAIVLLGAAYLAGPDVVSLDQLLHGESLADRLTHIEERVERQGEVLERLDKAVRELLDGR